MFVSAPKILFFIDGRKLHHEQFCEIAGDNSAWNYQIQQQQNESK